jgi:succinate dehydrogenase/fumarate reductase-like Fe-S protein
LKKKESNFGKKRRKKTKKKMKNKLEKNEKIQKKSEKKKECTVDLCCNPQCIWVWGNNDFPTPFSYTRWHARALPRTYKTNVLDSVIIMNQR